MGVFVEALDIAIVNLALPLIEKSLGLSSESSYKLQSAYVLVYGCFLLLGGKLTDYFGRKNIFLAGSFIFLVTSLGAGLSTSFTSLVIFRAVQGLGAALLMPAAFAIINYYFSEPGERSKAIGIFSSFAAVGSGSGLSVGGIIANYWGWSWVFLINVPVLVFIIAVAFFYLGNDRPAHKSKPDIISALALIIAMFFLTWTTEMLPHLAKDPLKFSLLLSSTILFGVLLYRRLKRADEPLIDLQLLNVRSLRTGNTLFILLGAIFTGYLFLISYIMQEKFNYAAFEAGLMLMPFSFASAIFGKFVLPRMLRFMNDKIIAIIGTCSMLLGATCIMLALHTHQLALLLAGGACIAGIGMILCFTGYSVIAMEKVPEEHLGVGASLTSTAYFIGGGIGLPLLSFLLNNNGSDGSGPIMMLGSFAVLGLVLLGGLRRHERRTQPVL